MQVDFLSFAFIREKLACRLNDVDPWFLKCRAVMRIEGCKDEVLTYVKSLV